ncbi:Rgs6 [Dirofilaria immitis]|nr:Rgs6 [Dirofilaria immitis]
MAAYTLAKLDSLSMKIAQSAPLKTLKYFRVAVPQALTGQTLVAFLQELMTFDDLADALHLATLLLQHGYIFPVIEHSLLIKDDNTLYRLQLPYFWPSHATQTDNVEYAIYLNKRLMRNEQKHGLEEDEVDAYNKLLELLGHMWDFITVQAEIQLKIQKEKKKSDKVVYDSEERAFWRTRRPGQANCLEQHIQHCIFETHTIPEERKKLRKRTAAVYQRELERLKFTLKTKPWLKAMKASETMVSWCEQFHDYDPFISTPQPSNPWISDDTNLWVLNTDSVEVPTERRVKRWGLSVQELVRDPIGRQVLETFLESEFSSENIRFWMAIQDLKFSANEQVEKKAHHIYEEFLASGAPCQVNVDSRTLEITMKSLEDKSVARRHAFSPAEEHIFTLMSKDSYPRFLRSQIYREYFRQLSNKRLGWRNFVFNVGNQRKIPATVKQHKISRDDNSHISLPKQLSSDSLAVVKAQTQRLPAESFATISNT